MSLDLSVPTARCLGITELISATSEVLTRLLGTSLEQSPKIWKVTGAQLTSPDEPTLQEGALYLMHLGNDLESIEVGFSHDSVDELVRICPNARGLVYVTVRGAGENAMGVALAAATAAAAAAIEKTCIYDEGRNWTDELIIDPETFISRLSPKVIAETNHDAVLELCYRMHKNPR